MGGVPTPPNSGELGIGAGIVSEIISSCRRDSGPINFAPKLLISNVLASSRNSIPRWLRPRTNIGICNRIRCDRRRSTGTTVIALPSETNFAPSDVSRVLVLWSQAILVLGRLKFHQSIMFIYNGLGMQLSAHSFARL
jgi:hypothetical protein